ncbi:DUF1446 domain-containing protein [Deltaproteobacteria bacterium]|nr:DUF1446 domain-containing protein [Deltaproteobacteria bacterium]
MPAGSFTRIGGGGGFWGDQVFAPIDLLVGEELDYLTMDYLAEVTMSIMAKQKARDENRGWATDLMDWLRAGGISLLHEKRTRLVTNAGGANPLACAEAVLALACEIGWNDCRIAMVNGDDVLPLVEDVLSGGSLVDHMSTGQPLSEVAEDLVSANAYVGSGAIARALENGADIVVTGRVADASLIVGSMLHSEGWAKHALEKGMEIFTPVSEWAPKGVKKPLDVLAGWTLAGHLIECGAQVSGGNSSDWEIIPDLAELGYPIAEINSDGRCIITKSEGTGGRVSRRTVAEQLLYEIGDPQAYMTPDVVVDLSNTTLKEVSKDRVLVSKTKGKPAPPTLKVSASHRDGWFAASDLVIPGPDAIGRAEKADSVLRGRLSDLSGLEIYTEFFGAGASLPIGLAHLKKEPTEILIRWAAKSPMRSEIIEFTRAIAPLVLTGPAGVAGYSARMRPREQLRFFPFLLERELVELRVTITMMQTLRTRLQEMDPLIDTVLTRIQKIADGEPEGLWRRRVARRVMKRLQKPTTTGK